MAGLPWFELDVDMPSSPKCVNLGARLKNPLAFGYVVRIYAYCYRHGTDRFAGAGAIEDAARWKGKDGELVRALEAERFLDREGDALVVHGVAERLEPTLAKLARDAERHRLRREKAAKWIRGKPKDVRAPSAAEPQTEREASAGHPEDVRGTDRGNTEDVCGDSDKDKDKDSDLKAEAPCPSASRPAPEAPAGLFAIDGSAARLAVVPPKPKKPAPKSDADPRHHPIRLMLAAVYAERRGGQEMPWGVEHGTALKRLLSSVPNATAEEFERRWRYSLGLGRNPGTSDPLMFFRRWPELVPGTPAPTGKPRVVAPVGEFKEGDGF